VPVNDKGEFCRIPSTFRSWIKNDSSAVFQPEPNRYHLYVSFACPWAHRTLMLLKLKGLEHVISYSVVDWLLDMDSDLGWTLKDPHHPKFTHMISIYQLNEPGFDGNVTVPVLFDLKTQKIVNNESSEIIRMLNSEFNSFAKHPQLDLYPESLRAKIDELNDEVYTKLNNGVYRSGFATSQEAHDSAYNGIFEMLDKLEQILSKQRYLISDKQLTEADVRVWPTLLRFDIVYFTHFKCNKKLISKDYPNIFGYLREIYQMDGIKDTVNFEHIKKHYFISHTHINPSKLVPQGPDVDFEQAHGRK